MVTVSNRGGYSLAVTTRVQLGEKDDFVLILDNYTYSHPSFVLKACQTLRLRVRLR